jgi:hypothetical protein
MIDAGATMSREENAAWVNAKYHGGEGPVK